MVREHQLADSINDAQNEHNEGHIIGRRQGDEGGDEGRKHEKRPVNAIHHRRLLAKLGEEQHGCIRLVRCQLDGRSHCHAGRRR